MSNEVLHIRGDFVHKWTGSGVYAKENTKKGQFIIQYQGEVWSETVGTGIREYKTELLQIFFFTFNRQKPWLVYLCDNIMLLYCT